MRWFREGWPFVAAGFFVLLGIVEGFAGHDIRSILYDIYAMQFVIYRLVLWGIEDLKELKRSRTLTVVLRHESKETAK